MHCGCITWCTRWSEVMAPPPPNPTNKVYLVYAWNSTKSIMISSANVSQSYNSTVQSFLLTLMYPWFLSKSLVPAVEVYNKWTKHTRLEVTLCTKPIAFWWGNWLEIAVLFSFGKDSLRSIEQIYPWFLSKRFVLAVEVHNKWIKHTRLEFPVRTKPVVGKSSIPVRFRFLSQ